MSDDLVDRFINMKWNLETNEEDVARIKKILDEYNDWREYWNEDTDQGGCKSMSYDLDDRKTWREYWRRETDKWIEDNIVKGGTKMTLSRLAELIEIAINGEPPQIIRQITGQYYQPYYYLFYLLTKDLRAGNAVELGVSKGYGIFSLASGNVNVKVIGFDHNVEPFYTLPNVDFHFQSALPVPDFISDVAILHIDTEHSYGNALNEFMQYKSKLLPGAVVCFDDLHAMDDGVLRAFYELPYSKIQCDDLHPINGYGVLIYE